MIWKSWSSDQCTGFCQLGRRELLQTCICFSSFFFGFLFFGATPARRLLRSTENGVSLICFLVALSIGLRRCITVLVLSVGAVAGWSAGRVYGNQGLGIPCTLFEGQMGRKNHWNLPANLLVQYHGQCSCLMAHKYNCGQTISLKLKIYICWMTPPKYVPIQK